MRVIADFAYGCSRLEDRRPTVARQYVASVGAGAILKRIIRFLAQGLGRGLNNSVFQYGRLFVESLRAKCLTSSLTLKVYTDPSTSLLWWQCTVMRGPTKVLNRRECFQQIKAGIVFNG